MIFEQNVELMITNQGKYYKSLGYGYIKQGTIISVPLKDLPKNSNKKITAVCDNCFNDFERQFQLLNRFETHLCYNCSRSDVGLKVSNKVKGKPKLNMRGRLHPRWVEDKAEYSAYKREVSSFTSLHFKNELKDLIGDKLIGLCGVENAYQVDHLISLKYGFENNVNPRIIGHICNLSIKPWKENRTKDAKNEFSLWKLLSMIEIYTAKYLKGIR